MAALQRSVEQSDWEGVAQQLRSELDEQQHTHQFEVKTLVRV